MVTYRKRAAEKKAETEWNKNIIGAHPRTGKSEVQRSIEPHHAEPLIPSALAEKRSGEVSAGHRGDKTQETERQRRPFRTRKLPARQAVFPVEREAEAGEDKHDRRHGEAYGFCFGDIEKAVVHGERQQREHQKEIPPAEPRFHGRFFHGGICHDAILLFRNHFDGGRHHAVPLSPKSSRASSWSRRLTSSAISLSVPPRSPRNHCL